jgi:hypothetical protein
MVERHQDLAKGFEERGIDNPEILHIVIDFARRRP